MNCLPYYDLYVECGAGWMKVLSNGNYKQYAALHYKWEFIEKVKTKTVLKYCKGE